MEAYQIERDGDILRVAFGERAQNDQIVIDATARLDEMYSNGELDGGGLLKVNGPASLPVAMVLAHKLAHLFAAVSCYDPKVNKYVVTISHDPSYEIGDWVE